MIFPRRDELMEALLEPALSLRAWLLASTPAAFKARNIFCGDDLFRRA